MPCRDHKKPLIFSGFLRSRWDYYPPPLRGTPKGRGAFPPRPPAMINYRQPFCGPVGTIYPPPLRGTPKGRGAFPPRPPALIIYRQPFCGPVGTIYPPPASSPSPASPLPLPGSRRQRGTSHIVFVSTYALVSPIFRSRRQRGALHIVFANVECLIRRKRKIIGWSLSQAVCKFASFCTRGGGKQGVRVQNKAFLHTAYILRVASRRQWAFYGGRRPGGVGRRGSERPGPDGRTPSVCFC